MVRETLFENIFGTKHAKKNLYSFYNENLNQSIQIPNAQ